MLGMCGVLLTGCTGPVSYTDRPPASTGAVTKDWRKIEVVNLNQIRRDYDIIGECRGDAILDDAIDLKKQAAQLGADAISIPVHGGGGYIILVGPLNLVQFG